MKNDSDAKTSVALEQLEAGVRQLQSESAWREYLAVQGRFHHYSFGNALLIAVQRPTATRVAGFHTWKGLGYSVRKGEKGIAILAPVITRKTVTIEDEHGNELEQRVERVVFFKTVYVFDVSQVDAGPDARPLPTEVPGCTRLTGDAPLELRMALGDVAADLGFRVEYSEHLTLAGANGECDFVARTIRVRADLAAAQQVKTLAHELGHAILHGNGGVSREVAELEAESVAFVVCQGLGIDSGEYSFGYVSSWTGADAPKLIKACGERIQKAAKQILDGPAAPAVEAAGVCLEVA